MLKKRGCCEADLIHLVTNDGIAEGVVCLLLWHQNYAKHAFNAKLDVWRSSKSIRPNFGGSCENQLAFALIVYILGLQNLRRSMEYCLVGGQLRTVA